MRKNIRENEEETEEVGSLTSDTDATRLSVDSVDDQIDSMMIDFESYSLRDSEAILILILKKRRQLLQMMKKNRKRQKPLSRKEKSRQ